METIQSFDGYITCQFLKCVKLKVSDISYIEVPVIAKCQWVTKASPSYREGATLSKTCEKAT
jgi:hypothetical protein